MVNKYKNCDHKNERLKTSQHCYRDFINLYDNIMPCSVLFLKHIITKCYYVLFLFQADGFSKPNI